MVSIWSQLPHLSSTLWRVIEKQTGTITVLQARVTVLEAEVAVERNRRVRAEDEKTVGEAEAERFYYETLRLESRLP